MSFYYNNYKFSILLIVIFFVSVYFYFPFSAEDSYIVARYAYNFANFGKLAYNIDEPISALTSPLHALILGILFKFFAFEPVKMWKCVSILLYIISIYKLCSLLKSDNAKKLFLIMTLLSSSTILWIVGGLETILLLFFISIISYKILKEEYTNKKDLIILGFLFSFSFLTRFDSGLFLFPIWILIIYKNKFLLKKFSYLNFPILIIIFTWFLFSYCYYGHLMPTSFFIKKPGLDISHTITTLNGLFWVGLIPLFFILLFYARNYLKEYKIEEIVILISILFIIMYMCTMAKTHMMFGLRSFIMYLPITFLLCIMFLERVKIKIIILGFFFIFQTFQIYITYNYGINFPITEKLGIKFVPENIKKYFLNEYALLSLPNYVEFMKVLSEEGKIIDQISKSSNKQIVVLTYAEGIASYEATQAFFTGLLVTSGKCKYPDYVMSFHMLDFKKDWAGIPLDNNLVNSELDFYINKLSHGEHINFSLSKVEDLDDNIKDNIKKVIQNCNNIKIW